MLAALVTGCDFDAFVSEPAAATCAASGEQCQLPDGPLGVCEAAPCPPDAAPPCFACTPQH